MVLKIVGYITLPVKLHGCRSGEELYYIIFFLIMLRDAYLFRFRL